MSLRTDPTSRHSAWQFRAALLVLLEGFGLLGLSAWYVVLELTSEAQDAAGALVTLLFAVGAGVVLLLLARSLSRSRAWARTPALVVQIFVFVVGAPLVFGERWYVGLPLVLLALVTGLALLAMRPPEPAN